MPFGSSLNRGVTSAPTSSSRARKKSQAGRCWAVHPRDLPPRRAPDGSRECRLRGKFVLPVVRVRARSHTRLCAICPQKTLLRTASFLQKEMTSAGRRPLEVNEFTLGRFCSLQAPPKGCLGCVRAWERPAPFPSAEFTSALKSAGSSQADVGYDKTTPSFGELRQVAI